MKTNININSIIKKHATVYAIKDSEKFKNAVKELESTKEYVKLEEVLGQVQSLSRVRTASVYTICKEVIRFESTMKLTRKALAGCRITLNVNAQTFPSAYKYVPEATIVEIEYDKSGHARVTDVRRARCGNDFIVAYYTDAAKKEIIYNFSTI